MQNVDFSNLQDNVSDSAAQLHAACCAARSEETFYGFAFVPDDDVQSFYWMADTVESLEQSSRKMQKQAAKHGGDQSVEEISQILNYACNEWAYGEESLELAIPFDCDLRLSKIWTMFRSQKLKGSEYDNGFRTVRTNSLEAIANGLNHFRAEAALDDQLVTLVDVSDTGKIDELFSLAKLCNSKMTHKAMRELCAP